MEQILVDFVKIEVEYVQNIKETLKFIKQFQKLCNHGDPVAQIPEELSENSDILDQTFQDYQDIFDFNKKLSKILDKHTTIDAFSLGSFFPLKYTIIPQAMRPSTLPGKKTSVFCVSIVFVLLIKT